MEHSLADQKLIDHTDTYFSYKLFIWLNGFGQWIVGSLEFVNDFLSKLEFDIVDEPLVVSKGVVELLFVQMLLVHIDK